MEKSHSFFESKRLQCPVLPASMSSSQPAAFLRVSTMSPILAVPFG